jgi:IS30 family transposase
MPKPYQQLTQSEREHIANLLSEGYSLGDIAKALGRNKSTISRELARNSAPERQRYTPCRAHARACERRTSANTHERLKNEFIRQYVKDGLEKGGHRSKSPVEYGSIIQGTSSTTRLSISISIIPKILTGWR